MREVGIVEVARQLLVAMWNELESGEGPTGAEEVEKRKFRGVGGGRRASS